MFGAFQNLRLSPPISTVVKKSALRYPLNTRAIVSRNAFKNSPKSERQGGAVRDSISADENDKGDDQDVKNVKENNSKINDPRDTVVLEASQPSNSVEVGGEACGVASEKEITIITETKVEVEVKEETELKTKRVTTMEQHGKKAEQIEGKAENLNITKAQFSGEKEDVKEQITGVGNPQSMNISKGEKEEMEKLILEDMLNAYEQLMNSPLPIHQLSPKVLPPVNVPSDSQAKKKKQRKKKKSKNKKNMKETNSRSTQETEAPLLCESQISNENSKLESSEVISLVFVPTEELDQISLIDEGLARETGQENIPTESSCCQKKRKHKKSKKNKAQKLKLESVGGNKDNSQTKAKPLEDSNGQSLLEQRKDRVVFSRHLFNGSKHRSERVFAIANRNAVSCKIPTEEEIKRQRTDEKLQEILKHKRESIKEEKVSLNSEDRGSLYCDDNPIDESKSLFKECNSQAFQDGQEEASPALMENSNMKDEIKISQHDTNDDQEPEEPELSRHITPDNTANEKFYQEFPDLISWTSEDFEEVDNVYEALRQGNANKKPISKSEKNISNISNIDPLSISQYEEENLTLPPESQTYPQLQDRFSAELLSWTSEDFEPSCSTFATASQCSNLPNPTNNRGPISAPLLIGFPNSSNPEIQFPLEETAYEPTSVFYPNIRQEEQMPHHESREDSQFVDATSMSHFSSDPNFIIPYQHENSIANNILDEVVELMPMSSNLNFEFYEMSENYLKSNFENMELQYPMWEVPYNLEHQAYESSAVEYHMIDYELTSSSAFEVDENFVEFENSNINFNYEYNYAVPYYKLINEAEQLYALTIDYEMPKVELNLSNHQQLHQHPHPNTHHPHHHHHHPYQYSEQMMDVMSMEMEEEYGFIAPTSEMCEESFLSPDIAKSVFIELFSLVPIEIAGLRWQPRVRYSEIVYTCWSMDDVD